MFQSARISLTAWYLVIITLISSLFSVSIYIGVNNELHRMEHFQKLRQIEREKLEPVFEQYRKDRARLGVTVPPGFRSFRISDPEIIPQVRVRLITILVLINLGIISFAGIAGYFLAGRTLTPIAQMVSEQHRFISDASHELRTPLTALKTATEVGLRDKNLTLSQVKALLKGNLYEIGYLQMLSDSLLRLSQLEHTGGVTIGETVELSDVLAQSRKKVLPLARKSHITINIPRIECRLEGDAPSLVELITVLLDNAIKYSLKKSSVDVSADSTEDTLVLRIADHGIGIDRRDIPHIFDRFYRADKARSRVTSGYGLGLSIAKKIVELHHGTIHVESIADRGTTFTVRLPMKRIQA